MSLPKIIRQSVAGLLLASFLVAVSPIPTLATQGLQQNRPYTPSTELPSGDYKIVPIPPPSGEEEVAPLPEPNQSYQIQQANIFEDIGKALLKPIVTITDFAKEKAVSAAKGIMAGVEYVLIEQLGGNVVEGLLDKIASGNPAEARLYLREVMEKEDPSQFGIIGLAGATTNTLLDVPVPISSTQYFASINPFKPANAAIGDSQAGLSGPGNIILELWKKARNVAYVLAVVALVIVGFLIMIRMPLGPRAVVTAQAALPRIALALILITFSYAISGLLIDITKMAAGIINDMITIQWGNVGMAALGFIGLTALGSILFGASGGVALLIVLGLALIILIITLIIFIMLIFKLLTRYVTFLLLTIFAPFFFLLGAIPGMEGAIFAWFRRSLAALVAIPAVALILRLSIAIGFSGFDDVPIVDIDGLVGSDLDQFVGWFALAPIVGLGLFFFATKVPEVVDQIFDIKPAPRGGIGPGAIIAAPMGIGKGAVTLSRGVGYVQPLAQQYATEGGRIQASIGRGILRLPFVGSPGRLEKAAQDRVSLNEANQQQAKEGQITSTPTQTGTGTQGKGKGQGPRDLPPPPNLGPKSGRGAGGLLDPNRPTRRRQRENEQIAGERKQSEDDLGTRNY